MSAYKKDAKPLSEFRASEPLAGCCVAMWQKWLRKGVLLQQGARPAVPLEAQAFEAPHERCQNTQWISSNHRDLKFAQVILRRTQLVSAKRVGGIRLDPLSAGFGKALSAGARAVWAALGGQRGFWGQEFAVKCNTWLLPKCRRRGKGAMDLEHIWGWKSDVPGSCPGSSSVTLSEYFNFPRCLFCKGEMTPIYGVILGIKREGLSVPGSLSCGLFGAVDSVIS